MKQRTVMKNVRFMKMKTKTMSNGENLEDWFNTLGEFEMSGGGLCDYCQYALGDIIEDLEEKIEKEDYSEDIKILLLLTITDLRKNAIILQRIDWLISGDDGIENFYKRLTKQLKDGK